MRILDRYIGVQVIGGAFLALAVLLSVFALLDFIEDLDSVDQGSYSVWGAMEFQDELPKTMVGKLSKKDLREEEEARRLKNA